MNKLVALGLVIFAWWLYTQKKEIETLEELASEKFDRPGFEYRGQRQRNGIRTGGGGWRQ